MDSTPKPATPDQTASDPAVARPTVALPTTAHPTAAQPAGAQSTGAHPALSTATLAAKAGRGAEPVRRRRAGRVVAGVAGGVADHLGIEVFWVRAVFAALTALNGVGIVAYGLLWLFVPQRAVDTPEKPPKPQERQQALGLVALGIAAAVISGLLSGPVSGWIVGPLAVALVGAAVVWREADEAQRRRWRDGARSGLFGTGRAALVRVLSGVALVAIGIGVLLISSYGIDQLRFALLAVVATLGGVAVLTVPLWIKLINDLGEERRVRIRTEERAEIAAHLHDSVLQTLALIQKQSDNQREVKRLARGQERQLRDWLYGPAMGEDGQPTMMSAAIAKASGEVEDQFAIAVQQVVVGDCALDHNLLALVQAAREAMVNAAKHAGVGEISVYGEVEPERVTVFVRDRGKGFDPDLVPEDRHGLADSIRGRMDRHGGEVRLRTTPGEGTEVQLYMPRKTAGNQKTEART
ncbi:ATP-binding protein [Saccharothrix espanaensis]|uniref:Two-component system, sensor histidine kinase n=1 Tax=Saccharothrix espanaensis (strain ATCC 51144 / DSM 44229 / JCM 9112 / NBRC 15066 / NRRL 15764) TaxID=1179773 RepID=K0KC02_SACES|nr:Two-component system, sensor histidine kinase [Saccharothrix espanaensis DSM 44229]